MLEFSSAKHLVGIGAVSKTKFSCFIPASLLSVQKIVFQVQVCSRPSQYFLSASSSPSLMPACLPACEDEHPIYFSTGKIYGNTVLIFN